MISLTLIERATPGMYADDTQVTAASKTVKELEETLNRDMENLGLWLRANRLATNTTKTELTDDYCLKLQTKSATP